MHPQNIESCSAYCSLLVLLVRLRQNNAHMNIDTYMITCIFTHKYTYMHSQRHYYRCIHVYMNFHTYVYMNFHIHAYANKYSHTHLNKHPLCISNFAVFFQNDSLQKNNTDKIYMQVQFISKYLNQKHNHQPVGKRESKPIKNNDAL